jgi:hypothetical protein
LSQAAPANATVTGRKRTALDPSCPIQVRRSPRLSSEHSAPGSGKCAQPDCRSSIDSLTRSLDSRRHLRSTFATGCLSATLSHTAFKSQEKFSWCRSRAPCDWLAVYSADFSSYRFSAVYWRTLFCRWAGPTCFLRD